MQSNKASALDYHGTPSIHKQMKWPADSLIHAQISETWHGSCSICIATRIADTFVSQSRHGRMPEHFYHHRFYTTSMAGMHPRFLRRFSPTHSASIPNGDLPSADTIAMHCCRGLAYRDLRPLLDIFGARLVSTEMWLHRSA